MNTPPTEEELIRAILLMRTIGIDLQNFEVKTSKKELSKDIEETLSAFSNGSGGTIICGLSEKDGFAPVPGFDPKSIQDSLANVCHEKMTPPVRPEIKVFMFEGAPILAATVNEMRPSDKPCYITRRKQYDGSFIRTGDGDRKLTSYEVERLLDEHRQPRYDAAIVSGATPDDLNDEVLDNLLKRERRIHARNFARLSDEEALTKLSVLRKDSDGQLRPTLAGLMAAGDYPQQFFPRLNVSFACYPGTNKSDVSSAGQRLLDSATLVGPIPYMVEDAIAAITRNMRTGAVIEGAFRKEVPDYPIVALREALANALMHRDYSEQSCGTPVQVDMYADRLEIINPGGLYGNVTVGMLGKDCISSSRNQHLSNLLENISYEDGTFVAENRGTGYQVIESSLSSALMPAPIPRDSIGFFSLTFCKRFTSPDEMHLSSTESVNAIVLGLLKDKATVSAAEVVRHSGKSRATVVKGINKMIREGVIEPTEPPRSPKQRYRLARAL